MRLLVGILGLLKRRIVGRGDGARRVGRTAHNIDLVRGLSGQELRLHALVPDLFNSAALNSVSKKCLVGDVKGVKNLCQRGVIGLIGAPNLGNARDLVVFDLDGHGHVVGLEVLFVAIGAQGKAGVSPGLVVGLSGVVGVVALVAVSLIGIAVGLAVGLIAIGLARVVLAVRLAGVLVAVRVVFLVVARSIVGGGAVCIRHVDRWPSGRGSLL